MSPSTQTLLVLLSLPYHDADTICLLSRETLQKMDCRYREEWKDLSEAERDERVRVRRAVVWNGDWLLATRCDPDRGPLLTCQSGRS